MVFSIYLLFAGHNAPGGGFAGGLVAGLALVVRYLAGGRYELDEAAPVDAGAAARAPGCSSRPSAGLAPLAASAGAVLQSARGRPATCRCSGEVHLVTSVFFDIGVYLVVVGLVLDLAAQPGLRHRPPTRPMPRRAATATAATPRAVSRR